MNRFLAFALLICSSATAEEIPLKSIWALDMSGTKSIYELEPEIYTTVKGITGAKSRELFDKSLTTQFLKALGSLKKNEQPGRGFAVSGTGIEALKNAVKAREKPCDTLPQGEVTLVIFSHLGGHVMVDSVSREGNKIEIGYRVKVIQTMDVMKKLALIPLGKLPAGKYDVSINRDEKSSVSRSLCKPFSFTVE